MTGATIGIMTLFALSIQPAEGHEAAAERKVTICVETTAIIPTVLAEHVASEIYAGIGINLDWSHERRCPEDALIITLTVNTPAGLMPGAAAYAEPYEGR